MSDPTSALLRLVHDALDDCGLYLRSFTLSSSVLVSSS